MAPSNLTKLHLKAPKIKIHVLLTDLSTYVMVLGEVEHQEILSLVIISLIYSHDLYV